MQTYHAGHPQPGPGPMPVGLPPVSAPVQSHGRLRLRCVSLSFPRCMLDLGIKNGSWYYS